MQIWLYQNAGGGGQACFGKSPKFSRFLIMRPPLITHFWVMMGKLRKKQNIFMLLLPFVKTPTHPSTQTQSICHKLSWDRSTHHHHHRHTNSMLGISQLLLLRFWPDFELGIRRSALIIEINIYWWKISINGSWLLMEDDLWWKTTFDQRSNLIEDGL